MSAHNAGGSVEGASPALRVGNRVSLPPLRQKVGSRAIETRKLVRTRQLEKLRKLNTDTHN